jgi:hypothetical protein
MKDFNEKAKVIENEWHDEIYEFEGHKIWVITCDRRLHKYYVVVDGKTVVTRCNHDNGVRFALKYLNEQ